VFYFRTKLVFNIRFILFDREVRILKTITILASLLAAAPAAVGGTVVGYPEVPSSDPFCAS